MERERLIWTYVSLVFMVAVLVLLSQDIRRQGEEVRMLTARISKVEHQLELERKFDTLGHILESVEPEKPSEPEKPKKPPRYGFTEDDIYLMTVVLCGSGSKDGDGEYDIDFGNQHRDDQISLVLGVIMNRVRSEKFPNTVKDVIWAKNQFSVMPQWKKGLPKVSDKSLEIVRDWCVRYDNHEKVQDIPEDHLYFKAHGPGGIENISRKGY